MFRTTAVLFVVAIGLIQAASCQLDRCPYAFAPDGTKYDLSMISNQVHQYVQILGTTKFTYNISICSAIPAPCSTNYECASPYSTGVCQSWGPSIYQAKCLGSYSNDNIVGLNNGAGVQISYFSGDVCGSCIPSGPRSTVITLTCNSYLSNPSKIAWTNVTVPSPGGPAVAYFNGEFYCPYTYVPVSAPVSSPYSPPSSRNCSNIRAPDGSFYDLSDLMGRVFWAEGYSSVSQAYYNATFGVCGGVYDYYCGECRSGSAAVCQKFSYSGSRACWGKFDSTATVQGLNYGQGVVITYDNGDYVTWGSHQKTVLTLTCNNWAFPSELNVLGTPALDQSTLYINASIGCYRGYTPVSSPWSSAPWSPPQPSWTPDGYVPNKHVSIQYHGYGSGCNGSDAFMVVVNRTQYCHPGCQVMGNKYVMTVCDDDVYLPRGVTWVEKINYGSDYYCDTPQYATYKKSGQCGGSFDFSYQACDANTVYTYSCNNPYCNQCTLSSKTSTNSCSNSSEYRCVNDFNGRAYPNPLM